MTENKLELRDSDTHEPRDFFFEMQKYSMYLRSDFVARQIAVADLYRQTLNLPGAVVELGIRNGATFFYLARLLEIYGPAARGNPVYSDRHIYGFDTFQGFPSIAPQDQGKHVWPEMQPGGVKTHNRDAFFKDFELFKRQSVDGERIHVVEGDVCETVPKFVEEHPGIGIALLYFDLDLYKPTLVCLEHLYQLVVPGGIVVFDEYAYTEFPGETKAVNEFFKGQSIELRRFPWSYCPSAYFIKQCIG